MKPIIIWTRRILAWMKTYASETQSWTTTFAIIAGGFWTYNRFTNQETEVQNPSITITTEIVHYTDTLRLLSVHVHPANLGKVPVEVCKNGLMLTLKKIPKQENPGFVDLTTIPALYRISDLANYAGGYEIEPGITYDEVRVFTVQQGDVIAVSAEVDYNDCAKSIDEIDATNIVKIE